YLRIHAPRGQIVAPRRGGIDRASRERERANRLRSPRAPARTLGPAVRRQSTQKGDARSSPPRAALVAGWQARSRVAPLPRDARRFARRWLRASDRFAGLSREPGRGRAAPLRAPPLQRRTEHR